MSRQARQLHPPRPGQQRPGHWCYVVLCWPMTSTTGSMLTTLGARSVVPAHAKDFHKVLGGWQSGDMKWVCNGVCEAYSWLNSEVVVVGKMCLASAAQYSQVSRIWPSSRMWRRAIPANVRGCTDGHMSGCVSNLCQEVGEWLAPTPPELTASGLGRLPWQVDSLAHWTNKFCSCAQHTHVCAYMRAKNQKSCGNV